MELRDSWRIIDKERLRTIRGILLLYVKSVRNPKSRDPAIVPTSYIADTIDV